MKKLMALLLCLMMTVSMMGFAAAESTVPNVANTYFSYGYDAGGLWMDYFFHLYDEIPGLGKVFYAGFCLNQITFTGTYEIMAEEKEYACWPDRAAVEAAEEGAAAPTGKAPYTIVFYDFNGNEMDRCAMDETHIYNDMANITGTGGNNSTFNLDTDIENSKFADTYGKEQAVSLLNLINPDDDTGTLDIKINGKYDDLVVAFVEGTWTLSEDGKVYTLTSTSSEGEGATVTLNDDGTYTYVAEADGEEVILNAIKAASVAYTFKSTIAVPGMEGVEADLICRLMDDGTVTLAAEMGGFALDVDKGTYEIDMTTYTITFHFEAAGDAATYFTETGMAVDYKVADVQPFGAIEKTLTMVQE
jgi:hypothetical protein